MEFLIGQILTNYQLDNLAALNQKPARKSNHITQISNHQVIYIHLVQTSTSLSRKLIVEYRTILFGLLMSSTNHS